MAKSIIFNPNYFMKPDIGRTLIMAKYLGRQLPISDGFETFIHPIHAVILSFMNGEDMDLSVEKVSKYLNVDNKIVFNFIDKIIDNDSFIAVHSKQGISTFPPNTLISTVNNCPNGNYIPEMFIDKNVDLRSKRHATPTSIVLMVNNRCLTDCFYCYADRRKKIDCQIPLSRIKELIREAKDLNVRSFDVIGGEFFLYKEWRELLKELHEYEYYPYLSTKMPLSENDIKSLVDMGIMDLQISLDTLIDDNLIKIINVKPTYIGKMKNTLALLNKYKVKVFIHTVLTQLNDSIEDMISIADYIMRFDNIIEWKIDRAGSSLYLTQGYAEIKPREENIEKIKLYTSTLAEKVKFPIRCTRPIINNEIIDRNTGLSDFFNRGLCSGNYSGFFILPDGKVTLCEELYWMPKFILGDVLNDSLLDVWNSKNAIKMFYLSHDDFPKDSLCSSCEEFIGCRSVRQICWKETIKQFGKDKWYYPDVNCPKLLD